MANLEEWWRRQTLLENYVFGKASRRATHDTSPEDEKHAAYDDTSSMENGLPAAIPETASHVAARSTDEADPSLAAHMTGNTTLSKQHVAQKPEEERKLQHTLPEEEVQEELLEAKAAAKEEEEEEDTRISTQQEEQAAEVHTLFHFSVLL